MTRGAPTMLTTERLLLEPWSEAGRRFWIDLLADPEVTRWLGTGEPLSRDSSEKEFEWMLRHWAERGFGWRFLIDRSSGARMGAVGLNVLEDNPAGLPPDDIEIGWWLLPEFWGCGFATEAAVVARDEAFRDGIADHIWARFNVNNPGSGRIMEKIGMTFVRDGTGVAGVPIRIYELGRARWEALSSARSSGFATRRTGRTL